MSDIETQFDEVMGDDEVDIDEDGPHAREVLDREDIEKRLLAAQGIDEVFAVFENLAPPSDPRAGEWLRSKVLDHLMDLKIRTKAIDQWLATAPPAEDVLEDIPYVPEAPPIAHETDILAVFGEAIAAAGLVGEQAYSKLLYLASTTRLLKKPVSVVGKGPSAAGKSEVMKRTLVFLPPEAYLDLTSMSEHFLHYSPTSFAHRHVVIYEVASTEASSFLEYVIRSLLSEQQIKHGTVVKDSSGRMVGKEIVKPGPTGLFTTTTRLSLHPENETRTLSITVDDSPSQTRRVMRGIASEDEVGEPDTAEWHDLQRWLAQQRGLAITVPFAHELAEAMPDNAVRLRRDFGAILALIRAHAILHFETRERDERGRVVATETDYEAMRHLVGDVIGEAVGAKVTEQVRETVAAVAALEQERIVGVNSKQVAEFLGIDISTAWRRLRQAAKNGFVRDHRIGRTGPNDWRTEDQLPEDQTMLPPLRGLTRDCDDGLDGDAASDQGDCMIATETRGVESPGTLSAQGVLPLALASNQRNPANAQVIDSIGTRSPSESVSKPVQTPDDCPECGCSRGKHFHNCRHVAEEGA